MSAARSPLHEPEYLLITMWPADTEHCGRCNSRRVLVVSEDTEGRPVKLSETYSQRSLHENWRAVYRRDERQLALDDEVYDWIFTTVTPGSSWLDAGCGSGERTAKLVKYASSVVAVDISPEILIAAKETVDRAGAAGKIQFLCSALEDIGPVPVQNVHCRGVLMHIPEWRTALANLCRLIQPEGWLVLVEADAHSAEAALVRLIRSFSKRKSQLAASADGLEFWSEVNGKPFLVRMARFSCLRSELESLGFEVVLTRPVQFIDINRVPESWRWLAFRLNRLWYRFALPFGSAVILLARRASG